MGSSRSSSHRSRGPSIQTLPGDSDARYGGIYFRSETWFGTNRIGMITVPGAEAIHVNVLMVQSTESQNFSTRAALRWEEGPYALRSLTHKSMTLYCP
jgi:hypothetical protein